MVFNGNFDNGLSGWTVNGTTEPSIASANFLAEKGTGALITTGTLDGSIWQAVSGSVNQKYLITFDIVQNNGGFFGLYINCLLYTSPSPRDRQKSRMPSSA